LVWTINFSEISLKQLKKLNISVSKKIIAYMDSKVRTNSNPRNLGKALSLNKAGLWRYRIGDYRVICKIHDEEIIILVLEIGHRKDIYE
jgi:mRNA interferase RelE/StbE